MKIYIIFIILIIYNIFYTPKILINHVIKNVVKFNIKYINSNSIINYNINHGYFDGSLFNHYLKNNLFSNKIKITENIRNINKNYVLNIPKHYILNYSRYKNFSKFVSCISFFTKYVLFKYTTKNILNIGIVINTRSKDNLKFGNYELCKSVIINEENSMNEIAVKFTKLIKKYKNTNSHTRFTTGISYLYADFVFNSHKDFSEIQKSGYSFYYENIYQNKEDLIKIIKSGKKMIVLNYKNNYYYINCIKNIL